MQGTATVFHPQLPIWHHLLYVLCIVDLGKMPLSCECIVYQLLYSPLKQPTLFRGEEICFYEQSPEISRSEKKCNTRTSVEGKNVCALSLCSIFSSFSCFLMCKGDIFPAQALSFAVKRWESVVATGKKQYHVCCNDFWQPSSLLLMSAAMRDQSHFGKKQSTTGGWMHVGFSYPVFIQCQILQFWLWIAFSFYFFFQFCV